MKTPRQSALKQIRNPCLACCGGSVKLIRFCPSNRCPHWYFRLGESPKRVIRKHGLEADDLFDQENHKKDPKIRQN
jgi:hypothetical protein